jgi:Flp pilus assembly protein TadG
MRSKNPRAKGFWKDSRGNFASGFAMIVSTICLVTFGGLELAQIVNVKAKLQDAADSAALAAAREISVMGASTAADQTIKRVVNDMFFANSGASISDRNAVVTADYAPEQGVLTVDVTLDANVPPLLRYALKVDKVHAMSQARIAGKPNICVVGLETSGTEAVGVKNNSKLNGMNCGVYANSSSSSAIDVSRGATLSSQFTCSRGGVRGDASSFAPQPVTDCPAIDDPLANRPEPKNADAPCDFKPKTGSPTKVTKPGAIDPGVYCGGLEITVVGKVTANPGTYIIRDGNLKVDSETQFYGRGVSFFLKGKNTNVVFAGKADIDLEAPADGEMAGILLSDARDMNPNTVHVITSASVRRLVGAIYFPKTQLSVDAPGQVAQDSPWTAIIARKLTILQTSQVVLNSNFGATEIPAPAGVQGAAEPIRLIK